VDSYFSNNRSEMLSFIQNTPVNVLDIGCGSGVFGASLKRIYDCTVTGIEPIEHAGLLARRHLDSVYICSFDEAFDSLHRHSFDHIIMNDSLEHMAQPELVLDKIKHLLVAEGTIIISVPNVRFVENIYNLIFKKDWQYTDYGILDKTHLRFFTQKSLVRLVKSKGFNVTIVRGINPTASRFFKVLNFLLFDVLNDMQWLQTGLSAQIQTF
jgi:2-polyprenyl-3-methyl-5-hydroxy-6-metoxy-1,4-benzoquinol methylase